MLRHLLTSAARTSSRSLFTKPKASVNVSSLRTLSDQKASTACQKKPLSRLAWFAAGWMVNTVALVALVEWAKGKSKFDHIEIVGKAHAKSQLHDKPDPFEGAKVNVYIVRPVAEDNGKATNVVISSIAQVRLPKTSLKTDFEKICDGLKWRGIDVEECSEEGARRGLIKYARKKVDYVVKKIDKGEKPMGRSDPSQTTSF